ncbi:hypothetical protein J5X84_43650 [Streptosporangiaceae bacterium NEAU-GS5]|nr:hypothetical protein [Streptosporangiaceae bacterium NEAU-GS5]
MQKTAYVYVPAGSATNFAIGLRESIWGWRSAALDKADSRAIVSDLGVGDYLVFGHHGPSSRVAVGGWADAHLRRIVVSQIIRPLYTDQAPVWPDDVYPERVDLDVLSDDPASTLTLPPDAMEALRMSANKQGTAMFAGADALLTIAAAPDPHVDASVEDEPLELGAIEFDGSTDVVRAMLGRREQAKIRRAKFGTQARLTCSLCGRTLPRALVRIAHVKRRSMATHAERLDMDNVIAACNLGCDALFEDGYIYVDPDGVIQPGSKAATLPDLAIAAKTLQGTRCREHTARTDPFFEFHRQKIAGI